MAALIPAGISIVGGLLSKGSKDKEAKRMEAAGQASIEQLKPWQERGNAADETISNALSGGAGSAKAFEQFQNSNGYQAQLKAGNEGIVGNQATKGLLNSGSTLKRQTQFGNDLAQQGFSNFLGQLNSQANRGANAAGNVATATMNQGNNVASKQGEGSDSLISGIGQAAKPIGNFLSGLF
tara:strand:+ start:20898 stop:21440 length:543 start_codon:yes stop_codon:yes gene_type:complete